MSTPEFPPNSQASKRRAANPKSPIERVTSSDVKVRKRSLRKQFSETFVAGDARTAFRYVVFEVLLPAAKDMIVDAGAQGLERLIYGDSRRRGGSRAPLSGATGYVSYNRISSSARVSSQDRVLSRQARAAHRFDEIILDKRTEAEEVIDQLLELVSKYDEATVADLYDLVGLSPTHTDNKWGWRDLHGAGVSRVRGGYLLDLPDPDPLD